MSPQAGTHLGSYEVTDLIGQGGMGTARKSPPPRGLEGWTIHGITPHVRRPRD